MSKVHILFHKVISPHWDPLKHKIYTVWVKILVTNLVSSDFFILKITNIYWFVKQVLPPLFDHNSSVPNAWCLVPSAKEKKKQMGYSWKMCYETFCPYFSIIFLFFCKVVVLFPRATLIYLPLHSSKRYKLQEIHSNPHPIGQSLGPSNLSNIILEVCNG